MLSRPATGIARIEVITGVLEVVKMVMFVGSSFGMKLGKRCTQRTKTLRARRTLHATRDVVLLH
jgi:hypothetical protein